jgi:hypothetical protein
LLSAVIGLAGETAELLRHSERPWSSATFSGTRHTIRLSFQGVKGAAAAESFMAALPEHEFVIPRQLVADAAVVCVDHQLLPFEQMLVTAELLLLEDC